MHGSQLGRCSRSFGKGSAVRIMPDERGIYECSVDVDSMPTSTRDVSIVARKLEFQGTRMGARCGWLCGRSAGSFRRSAPPALEKHLGEVGRTRRE